MDKPFSINDDMMRAAVAKALLESVTPETRDELMKQAVADLMKPQKTERYGEAAPSMLQSAFNTAARQVAEDVARKWLAEDEAFKTQIQTLMHEVSDKVFGDKQVRAVMVDQLGELMRKAIEKLQRY